MSDLIIIYGFFVVFIFLGVLFLLQGGFFLKRYRRSVEENTAEDNAAALLRRGLMSSRGDWRATEEPGPSRRLISNWE